MKVSESAFQQAVIEFAQLKGYRVAHFRAARTKDGWVTPVAADGKGFPDLVLVRERLVMAELKSDDGRLSDDQHEWIAWLEGAGVETYVWRPGDWPEIERALSR